MNINLKLSKIMTDIDKEIKLVRLNKKTRKLLNVEVGDKLQFKLKTGDSVLLEVDQSHLTDYAQDFEENYCYLSEYWYNKISESEEHITIGADPEFFLIDKQTYNVICPSRYFNKFDQIGYDGMLAEIRPSPAKTSEELTYNISKLLKAARTLINLKKVCVSFLPVMPHDIKFIAASSINRHTAGFHVHLGLNKKLLGVEQRKRILLTQITNVLDNYVGILGTFVEGQQDYGRRCSIVRYGKAGDFRVDWKTYEYRVPSGKFLVNPILTEGLFDIVLLVVEDILHKIYKETNHLTSNLEILYNTDLLKDYYSDLLPENEINKIMCNKVVELDNSFIDFIYNKLSNMMNFTSRKEKIELFLSNINHNFGNNIELNWQEMLFESETKNQFVMQ